MYSTSVEKLYERHIEALEPSERIQLIELIARSMLRSKNTELHEQRSIMELHGLGKEIWNGIDAQEYVNELRREWDHRP